MNRRNSIVAGIALTTGVVLAGLYWKRKQPKSKKIKLKNVHGASEPEYYFHLYLDTEKDDIKKMFSGVRYLILTGSKEDATMICEYFQKELYGNKEPAKPISKDDRYRLHLCGPFLITSIGIGGSSISILLQEITKLLAKAEADVQGYICVDRSFSSILPQGSCVVCGDALAEDLTKTTSVCVLGEEEKREIKLSSDLAEKICANYSGSTDVHVGTAMGAQSIAKTLGLSPMVPATKEERQSFQEDLKGENILIINETAHIFGAFCGHLDIDAVILSTVDKTLGENEVFDVKATKLEPVLDVLLQHAQKTGVLIAENEV